MISGGRLSDFREGWAIRLTHSYQQKAHWFVRDGASVVRAACNPDLVEYAGRLFGIGTWTACKLCVAKHGEPIEEEREGGLCIAEEQLKALAGPERYRALLASIAEQPALSLVPAPDASGLTER